MKSEKRKVFVVFSLEHIDKLDDEAVSKLFSTMVEKCQGNFEVVVVTQATSIYKFRGNIGNQGKAQYEENGYSLFKYCNAVLFFEVTSQRASRETTIFGVMKT